MAYEPEAFDDIRQRYWLGECARDGKWSRIVKAIVLFAWGVLLSFAIGLTVALHYASALETLPASQVTIEKTGFSSVSSNPGRWGCTSGRFYEASRTEWLVVTMNYGCNNYNEKQVFTVGNVSWWANNWQDGQVGRNCGWNCNWWHEALIRGAVSVNPILGDWLDLEILVQTKNASSDPVIDHRWRVIIKKDGTGGFLASLSDYYTARNGSLYWVSHGGSDFVYKRLNATQDGWDDTWTLGLPVLYKYPATVPRCVETSAHTGVNEPVCFFRGQDGSPYASYLFGNQTALWKLDTWELTGGGWQNYVCDWLPLCEAWWTQTAIEQLAQMRPFWIIEPAEDNIAVFFDKYPYLPHFGAIMASSVTVSGLYEKEPGFLGVSGFVNPKIYFSRIDGTFWVQDLACVQPGFENCGQYNGGYACQSANGSVPLPPMPTIACNTPLEIAPYYWNGGGSSSGGGGSSSGGGGSNCTGSGCINQWTGSGAVSGLQEFFDYVTDCDTDNDWQTTIAEGLLCIPGSIGRFFGGIFDRLADVWVKTWSLIEATMKMSTPSGSGSQNPFSFDFIPSAYAESGTWYVSPWLTAIWGQVDAVKDNVNPIWKFIDYLYWGIIFVMFIAVVLIFAKARK